MVAMFHYMHAYYYYVTDMYEYNMYYNIFVVNLNGGI